MKKRVGGLGVYLLLLMGGLLIALLISYGIEGTNKYKYVEFVEDLEEGNIQKIVITQNEEVPTGMLKVILKGGTDKNVAVSDVNALIDKLDKENFTNWEMGDVERESWLVTTLLPCLITFVIVFVVFMLMTNQSAGGGGGGGKISSTDAKDATASLALLSNSYMSFKMRNCFLMEVKVSISSNAFWCR